MLSASAFGMLSNCLKICWTSTPRMDSLDWIQIVLILNGSWDWGGQLNNQSSGLVDSNCGLGIYQVASAVDKSKLLSVSIKNMAIRKWLDNSHDTVAIERNVAKKRMKWTRLLNALAAEAKNSNGNTNAKAPAIFEPEKNEMVFMDAWWMWLIRYHCVIFCLAVAHGRSGLINWENSWWLKKNSWEVCSKYK